MLPSSLRPTSGVFSPESVNMTHRELSQEMLSAAKSLKAIRTELYRLISEDQLPDWAQPDARTILLLGLDVANALDALIDAAPHPTSHLEEKR